MQRHKLMDQLNTRILILDGAMGTMLQKFKLSADDFGGPELEGCNEILNISRPHIVQKIHEAYLDAGADMIETNSFGATRIVLAEYRLEDKDIELNREAARLAREAADKWSTPDKPRFVAGSMGPTTKMLSLSKGISFEEFVDSYYRQALGLLEGGVDLFLIETSQDTLNVKAAGIGIKKALNQLGLEVPIMISCTIEPSGTMLAGQNIEAFYISIAHLKPIAVGLNCGTGAEFMTDHIRTLGSIATCAVSCYPNAGLPDEEGNYEESPDEFADRMLSFARQGWLNIAGGCCGTTADHIRALAVAMQQIPPRNHHNEERSSVSGIEAVWPEEDNRPLLVGERTNVIGSRLFKEMIAGERFEEGAEIARAQVKKGAQVIDICVANPDRDELKDVNSFLPYVVNRVKAPLMLDSTDPAVIKAGLKYSQGKAIINSINLENGLERFEDIVPMIREYGAAVVVGLIDEQGMAITRERKLEVARRSYDLLVNQFGLSPVDIIFDPLTFPVGTGDEKYIGSAVETIEGLRIIKKEMPQCKTILGISNVSFGLPPAGREVLNAVFVYLNTLAGLDYAIVNAEKLQRYPSIPLEERQLAQDLLLDTNELTLRKFIEFYREKKVVEKKQISSLSLEERLSSYIVEGSKEGLEKDIKEALEKYSPLDIINGPLMKGMEEVGSLFNQNQLIVAEVLQSAEVMKAAVTLLEPYMERADQAIKGKVLLATVKGDVHDIGKNLVDIILSNNGYKVINLGVKVSSEQLIEACKREKPDVIGLSGLLVKSVQQMLLTAQDLHLAKINIPLILGGAALTRKFTEQKIAPEYGGEVIYAKDAMDSLSLLNNLMGKDKILKNNNDQNSECTPTKTNLTKEGDRNSTMLTEQSLDQPALRSGTTFDYPVFKPKELKRKLLLDYELDEIIQNVDIPLFMRRYLGGEKLSHEVNRQEFHQVVIDFIQEIKEDKLVKANGVYAFFPAYSKENSIYVLNSLDSKTVLEEFRFPRQQRESRLCLSDFVTPQPQEQIDYIGMFALTTGLGVREQAERFREQGQYLKSYLLQVLVLELAEGFAEKIHEIMRTEWGILDQNQGIRVSPGYPICPVLEDQKKVFHLLKPEEIGINLTESFMMDPEASITAIVFSHPKAHIFNVNGQ